MGFSQTNPWISEINNVVTAGEKRYVELTWTASESLTDYTLYIYNDKNSLKQTTDLSSYTTGTGATYGSVIVPFKNGLPGREHVFALAKVSDDTTEIISVIYAGNSTKLVATYNINGNSYTIANDIIHAGIDDKVTYSSLQSTTEGKKWSQIACTSSPGVVNDDNAILAILSVDKTTIEEFKIYPNPVINGELHISTKEGLEKDISIISSTGQTVYQNLIQANEAVYISNFTTGKYFIRVTEAGKTATGKIIVRQ